MPAQILPQEFISSAQRCGLEVKEMTRRDIPHLFLQFNKILSLQEIPGLILKGKELKNGFQGEIRVKKNAHLKKPVYFCFGLTQEKADQIILPKFIIEDGAKAKILAHCTFPQAKKISHLMKAQMKIGQGAELIYEERHYHGENSGALVKPDFQVLIEEGAIFQTLFSLTEGTVGQLEIRLQAQVKKNGLAQIESRALGKNKKDKVEIFDQVRLVGPNAKSLIKMRAAAMNGGSVFMQGETYASAPGALGHVDCQEIVQGKNSRARAVPIVEVTNDQARVTHEASVGKVNQKELEALLTRGLTEDQATEFILKGLLGF